VAKVKTSISIDDDLFEKLANMASDGVRSISQQIAYLIKKEGEVINVSK